jgi:hypothetical protein
MNMLRSTIQALEVQSATIATLQSMGETLSAAIRPETPKPAPEAKSEVPSPAAQEADPPSETATRARAPKSKKAAEAMSAAPGMANPAIWWNMLQDQFKQAVDTALASEKPEAAEETPHPAVKPAARKSTTSRKRTSAKPPSGK